MGALVIEKIRSPLFTRQATSQILSAATLETMGADFEKSF